MDAPVFACFPQLPLELRGMIWNETMPSDGPVMYPFGDHFINHTAKPAGSNGPPPMVQLPTPTALFVCREARKAAERWMALVNGSLYFRQETQGHIVVRPWDEEMDLLYVPRDKWRDFFSGMTEVRQQEGMDFAQMYERVRNLALPAFTAYYSQTGLLSAMGFASRLTAVHVVWGPLPSVRASAEGELSDAAVQPRWVIEPEGSEEVSMCITHDDGSGKISWETGELEDWMFELEQELALQEEIPEEYVDTEMGEITLPFLPVRLKKE
ncbi:unnamed protein product [Clonostachys rosea]|uniref:2EXR domain-containing protein n=1 Tax=Bionectria ochroleuca TaxID=29856 RepID=A0ABY6TSL0_BIOOC|nr:unnamed protein product [Clonostachys rosea]